MAPISGIRSALLACAVFLAAAGTCSASGSERIYGLELGFMPHTFSGGASPRATISPGYSVRLSRLLGPKLAAQVDYSFGTSYTDSTASSSLQIGSDRVNRISAFRTRRLSAALRILPFSSGGSLTPYFGAGLGVNIWTGLDAQGKNPLDTLGERNTRTEFKADELIISSLLGVESVRNSRFGLGLEMRGDYHTGAGAKFAGLVNDNRPRWLLSLAVSVRLFFGSNRVKRESWSSDIGWSEQAATSAAKKSRKTRDRDSDGDGVNDSEDKCPATPGGAAVNSVGCPTDTDGDGIYDGLDDCADTPPTALGLVDIYGCPIDSDFDGRPDFLDKCPNGPVGAVVDRTGCPVDTDGDSVADGLDDCPGTLPGLKVDRRGCLDMSYFAQPLVLDIKYEPGSFEIDRATEQKLLSLLKMLNAAPAVTIEIFGYTDNIGSASANRKLSEKRARRVRDFLLRQSVSGSRMRVVGRGETNFIADNSTRAGRQRNRRIEIVFRGI
ncbi:MAG: OmpA family protein [Candidatus Zixiibacteriota bacterium]